MIYMYVYDMYVPFICTGGWISFRSSAPVGKPRRIGFTGGVLPYHLNTTPDNYCLL
jgi:hypothetical protein